MSHSVIGIARCSLSFVCLGVLFTAVGVGCSGDNEQTADPESSVGKVASLEGGLALFQSS